MSDLDSIMTAVMSYVGGIFGSMFGQTGQTEVKLMVMGDGLGNLLVPPDEQIEPGEVWVHTPLGGDKRSVFKVLDPEGVGRAGEWVCVGKAPDSHRVVVLGRLQSMIPTYWQDAAARGEQVPLARRHAVQHYASGDDPLKVDWKQVVNLALVPVPGELKLRVVRGFYRCGDILHYLPHGLLTDDLSSYKPASTDDAVVLLVYLDPETQTLSYVAGDEFTVDRTKTIEDTDILDVWTNAPAAVPAGKYPLGCVLLTGRASMTEFLDKHVQAHVAAEATFGIWDAVYQVMGAGGDVDAVVQVGGLVALIFFTSSDVNAWTPATAPYTVPTDKVAAVVETRGSGGILTDSANRRLRLYNTTDSAEVVGYEAFAASGFPWDGGFPEIVAEKEVRLEVWNSDATERAMGGVAILRVRDV